MISICFGRDVGDLLRRVRQAPWQFSSVTLCSPYIDDKEARLIIQLLQSATKVGCCVTVITSQHAALSLARLLTFNAMPARRRVVVRDGLHAKFYLALARRANASEVIVTSANLTAAGLATNDELGIRAIANCDDGIQLVNKVSSYAQRLAA